MPISYSVGIYGAIIGDIHLDLQKFTLGHKFNQVWFHIYFIGYHGNGR